MAVSIVAWAAAGTLLYLAVHILTDSLHSFSGPLFARFSNVWRLYITYRGDLHTHLRRMHDRYGAAVRIGSNTISLSDVDLIKFIYANDEEYPKSSMWDVFTKLPHPSGTMQDTMLGTQDSIEHQRLRRPISKLYSINEIEKFAPLVNESINQFHAIARGETLKCPQRRWSLDMAQWTEYFSMDAMSLLTFSRPFGFMSTRTDVESLVSTANARQSHFSLVGLMPWLRHIVDRQIFTGVIPRSLAAKMTVQETARRNTKEVPEKPIIEKLTTEEELDHPEDFLEQFLAIQKNKPEKVDGMMILHWVMNNVIAGTDTVACALNAVIYYTLRHPSVHSKLLEELQCLKPTEVASYTHLRKSPYLSAIINEALRIYPVVNIPLERVVPEGGLQLSDGRVIPQGALVLMSAWVLHHQPVFGEDTDVFRPERWMKEGGEDEVESKERLRRMKAAFFAFSYGRRSCIGKELGLMEVTLFIARLFYEFEVTLSDPEKEWKVLGRLFVKQKGVNIALKPRVH